MTTYGEERTETQKTVDAIVKERVERGIMRLERKYGEEWVDKIDLKELRLQSGECCVLGQLWDGEINEQDGPEYNYTNMARRLFPDKEYLVDLNHEAQKFGFFHDTGKRIGYNHLQAEWKRRLTELKKNRKK